MKNLSIKNLIIVLTTLFFFSILFTVPAKSLDLKKALEKNPLDLLKKKKTDSGGGKSNLKNANTALVRIFFESSNNYLQAQELLLMAYGKNTEAAQVKEAIAYAKDSGVSDENKMKNSIKVTTESSKTIETSMNDQSYQLTAHGNEYYAKSLPFNPDEKFNRILQDAQTKDYIDRTGECYTYWCRDSFKYWHDGVTL